MKGEDVMPIRMSLEVVEHREVAPGHRELTLARPEGMAEPEPGQFVNVLCAPPLSRDPLLRRPFSFYRVTPGTLSVLYRVVGRGTALLAQTAPGARVDLVGPLGRGFRYQDMVPGEVALLVGGGVGVPPLFHLSQRLARLGIAYRALVGFASKSHVIAVDAWRAAGASPRVATDDGSEGHKGFVTDLLDEELVAGRNVRIFACGPKGMLAAVARRAKSAGVPCQVAMEEWMGCGMGVCLSCVCRVQDGEGWRWARICREGPVLEGSEVLWT